MHKPLAVVSPGKCLLANHEIPDIDLILGMDWLSKNKAQLDCAARQIQLTHSSEDVIVFAARDDTIRLFSLNEKGELDAISQIPVVCEYQDVFPEELPGMPPHRPVEFVIDLEHGTEPVCKRPYKLGPEELKELKKQLDMQENVGGALARPKDMTVYSYEPKLVLNAVLGISSSRMRIWW